jgi:transmembrane sensor
MTTRGSRALWDEAASWYARMQEPRSEQDVARFEAWLARDPAHAIAYAEMEAISAAAAAATPEAAPSGDGSLWPGWRPAFAMFALVATFVTALLLWPGASDPAFARITNPGEAVRSVRFDDGTQLWLDTGAAVRVSVGGRHREVVVESGRVRISPAAGKAPVSVIAKSVEVTPTAAGLDVAVEGDAVTVGAVGGALQLTAAGGRSYPLAPGRALIVEPGGTREARLEPRWPEARLRFNGERLDRIVARANRRQGPPIVFADPALGELTVTGVLDLRDTRRLARRLAAAHDLRLRDEGARLVLAR